MPDSQSIISDLDSPEPEHTLESALVRIDHLRGELKRNYDRSARLATFFMNEQLAQVSATEVLTRISTMLRDYLTEAGVAPEGADCWVRIELAEFGIAPGDVVGIADDVAIQRAIVAIGNKLQAATVVASNGRPYLVVPYALFDGSPKIFGWLGISVNSTDPVDLKTASIVLSIATWVRQHLERAASISEARHSTEVARIAARAQILMARPHELDDAMRLITELLNECSVIIGAAAVRFEADGARVLDHWGDIDEQRAKAFAQGGEVQMPEGMSATKLVVTIEGVPEAAFVLCSQSGAVSLADEMLATVAGAVSGSVARQRATETIKNLRRSATRQLIEAQERERSMIAADVHDGVLQQLGATAIRLELAQAQVERSDFDSARAIIEDGAKEIRSCARELRSLLMELRPQVLDDNGLSAAIKELGRNVEGVEIEVSTDVPDDLGNEYSITIFRIVQEALNNIQKHARATHARVEVHLDDGSIEIEITDDGVGYEAALAGPSAQGSHLGLLGMRERADMLGGTFAIEGRSGSGTRIVAVLPLKDRDGNELEVAGD